MVGLNLRSLLADRFSDEGTFDLRFDSSNEILNAHFLRVISTDEQWPEFVPHRPRRFSEQEEALVAQKNVQTTLEREFFFLSLEGELNRTNFQLIVIFIVTLVQNFSNWIDEDLEGTR